MAGTKIKVKVDTAKLKKVVEKKQKLIRHNIITVLKKEAIPRLIDRIMVGYDELSELAGTGPEDPTGPDEWRNEFLIRLFQDLEQTFIVSGNKISVRLGEKKFLGYTDGETIDPDDSTPLHWMVFYLEGLVGEWAFINPEIYKKITGKKYKAEWGRHHDGFMVSKETYHFQGWQHKIPFVVLRHPFSGFSPVDIFKEALDEFRLRPFIKIAISAAVAGRKL